MENDLDPCLTLEPMSRAMGAMVTCGTVVKI